MKSTELQGLLGRLEESPAPEPSALFVAKLEAELRAMDQTAEAEAPRPRTRRARVLIAAGPVAALTAAAAAAAVTLLPAKPQPHELKTADPGVTAPAQPSETPPSSVPTPTTVVAPPWLPPAAAPPAASTPTTTALAHPSPTKPAPGVGEHSTPSVVPPREPVATTVAPATTTTVSQFETPSLHCTGGVTGGQPVVKCTWSPSTSASFAWYRLYREVPGTNRVLVFSSDNRSTTQDIDTSVQQGTTYSYGVEVTDSAGNVIGRSAAYTVPCC
jgi:hypothetical protein